MGVELWPHKVEQLMKKHATTELYFSFPPKKPGPCDYLLINQTDTCFFAVALLIKTLSHTPRIITLLRKKVQLERIQSFPLKSVFPVSISAMIQPIDQISTVQREKRRGWGKEGEKN